MERDMKVDKDVMALIRATKKASRSPSESIERHRKARKIQCQPAEIQPNPEPDRE
jgi:hypothetical protein